MSNSSFWLYQKYIIIGNQDPIPVIPLTYSVSGDSLDPQPLVIKLENDPKCGYVPPVEYQYRDIESGYTCVDFDKYTKIVRQRSSDGIHWENVSYSAGTLIEHNSTDCGYVGELYRWVNSGTTCYEGDKYIRIVQQVSYDGINWTNTGQEARGTMIEAESPDCITYRWVNMDISTDYICDECPDYSKDYLTFIPTSGSSTFGWETPSASTASANTVYYSLDSGSTWISMASGETVTVGQGNKIFWKSSGLTGEIGSFTSTNFFDVEGNIMSLLYGDDFENATTFTNSTSFNGLFKDNTYLINTENLVLPATTLSERCYYRMFSGCTSLTTAPTVLPATTLAQWCYDGMFYDCSSLTTVPELPATTLASWCYYHMFWGCTSLTTAPELPATTLATTCYGGMFRGCTSLTTAPELPATTLAESCYSYMFDGCASLTTAPELPATTLAQWCYDGMFYDCTGLTTAPELPATTLAQGCYQSMFNGCTSLTTAPELSATTLADRCYCYMFRYCTGLTKAPELPATTLVNYCYGRMFYDCTNLNYIKCLATNISEYNCTSDWVYGVANSGTFVKASSMSSWTTGNNGIPTNWTVQNY